MSEWVKKACDEIVAGKSFAEALDSAGGLSIPYNCKNCGAEHYGEAALILKVGKVRILLGPCCALPDKPAVVEDPV